MPRPEQVMAPLANVREPVVSWDSTSTVSKWKLGAQPWPRPDEHDPSLALAPAQFEVRSATDAGCTAGRCGVLTRVWCWSCMQDYLDVLVKTMRESGSHAEREELMNSAVSGAFRLSHSQRVFREVLQHVDQHMTSLEKRLDEDRHDITIRRAYLEQRDVENKETYEELRSAALREHQRELDERRQSLSAKVEVERQEAATLQQECKTLSDLRDRLERQGADQRALESQKVAELQSELDAAQQEVAALANQRDQEREISGILRKEQAEAMEKVDEAFADTREEWAVFEAKRDVHDAAMQAGEARVADLRMRHQQLTALADDGGFYLEELASSNDDLEAEFVRLMEQGPAGSEWYPVAVEVQVSAREAAALSREAVQAKLVQDMARLMQVPRSKLVVLRVVREEELPPPAPGTVTHAFHIMLDEGIYLGYQSPVAGARFLIWQMDAFNKAAAAAGDPAGIHCRFLEYEEASASCRLPPVPTNFTGHGYEAVGEPAYIHLVIDDDYDMLQEADAELQMGYKEKLLLDVARVAELAVPECWRLRVVSLEAGSIVARVEICKVYKHS